MVVTRESVTAEPVTVPVVPDAPTTHQLKLGDARELGWLAGESVHLALTSPPYFNLKKYNDHPAQLGDWADYAMEGLTP
jgi:DNA modification methylase